MHSDQIQADAKIVAVLEHGAYRAELANGHRCIVRPGAQETLIFAPGESVRLAFHPADLSRARILPPEQK